MNGENPVLMSDVGELKDAHALQYNVVHVNGQRSVYLPCSSRVAIQTPLPWSMAFERLKPSGGCSLRYADDVVFDQSRFVRQRSKRYCTKGASDCSSHA